MVDGPLSATRMDQKIAVSVVYVAALFMSIMDGTIVNVALPALGHEFGVESAAVNGVVIYYLVALAAAIPVSGWLGDRLGGRRVLLGAVMLFVVASALCGATGSLTGLEIFRVIQGVAGGLMAPVGMAMLWRVFPPAERVRAASILIVPTAVAPALGPVLGGWFVTDMSWRWVFYVNVPVGLAALVFGFLFLGDQRLDEPGRFDVAGFVLASAGLGMAMFGVSKGPLDGWGTAVVAVTVVAGVISLVAFVLVEMRIAEPMLDLRILGTRLFGVCNLVTVVGALAFTGTLFVTSLYLQDGLGHTALQTGLSIFPEALGVMVGSQVVSKIAYPVLGPRRIMFAGLVLDAVMMITLTSLGPDTNLWWLRGAIFLIGFGMSGVFIPVQAGGFAGISHDEMGAATTLLNTHQQLGSAAGVAVLTTVFVAVGPVVMAPDGPVPNLAAYRSAFAVAGAFALVGAVVSLFIRDADAASTIARFAGDTRRATAGDVGARIEIFDPLDGSAAQP